jgi:ferric-dicitrate binding protein FerR (iron transport regulator)
MSRQDTKNVFVVLVRKYLDNKASKKEITFIEQYYDHFGKEEDVTKMLSPTELTNLENEIKGNIDVRIIKAENQKGFIRSITTFQRWAAAAIILVMVSAGVYLMNTHSSEKYPIALNDQSGRYKNDVAPGGDKAILILGDGSRVILDNTKNGTIGNQGNSRVLKIDAGKLAYNMQAGGKNIPKVIPFNTVSTPRGGQFQIELPDGSTVWLNATSSLRFPTAFIKGKERKVELTGEAYFEVTKNETMPFKVIVNKMEVQVLGTHFNVMAYNNEHDIKTTLLEGSVKINSTVNNKSIVIKPGQQASLDNSNSEINVSQNVDIDLVVAWKNGYTAFKSADITTIMRQVERWYDVDVNYEGTIPVRTFTGKISRNANLSELLRLLEVSKIHFTIDGRKITVLP